MSQNNRLDPATKARMAAKDMLRGLRHELDRLKGTHPVTTVLPSLPAEALLGIFSTVDRIAAAGEHLARDLLFMRRDHSRFADFFDPRAALVNDPDAGHRFVRSRYAALKLVSSSLTKQPVLISEIKIASALSSLSSLADDDANVFEANFTISLAYEAPISVAGQDEQARIHMNRLAALIVGLGGVVAAREIAREAQDLPQLMSLCGEIIKLRESRLLPVYDAATPEIILSSVFDELADALRDF